jgi:hypothetical protein
MIGVFFISLRNKTDSPGKAGLFLVGSYLALRAILALIV